MNLATSIDFTVTTFVAASLMVVFFVLSLVFALRHHFHRPGPQNVQHIEHMTVHNYPPGYQPSTSETENKKQDKDVKLKEPKKLEDEHSDTTEEETLKFETGASCKNGATSSVRKRNIKKPKSHSKCDQKHQKKGRTFPDLSEETNEAGSTSDLSAAESSEAVERRRTTESESRNSRKAFLDDSSIPKTEMQEDEEVEGAEDELAAAARTPASHQRPSEHRGKPDGDTGPDQKEAAVASLSSDVTQDLTIPATHNAESATDPYTFTVDEKGCNVNASYCKISIPPGAVSAPQSITMRPVYDIKECLDKKAFISPHVSFTSEREIAFQEDVTVSIHTSYTAIEKSVPIQVMWKKDKKSAYVPHKKVFHGKDRFIRFTCRHFCGYCCTADQRDFSKMRRHYYFAGYLRRARTAATRVFHWTVLEDCPEKLDHVRKLLTSYDNVIDPEIFHVEYGFNLQLHLDDRVVEVHGNDPHLDLVGKWGSRYLDPHQFRLENKHQETSVSKIDYEILAIHSQNCAIIPVAAKHFFLEWTLESQPNQTTYNVFDQATGVRVDQTAQLQQQTSVASNVSDVSSGYNSVPPTPSHGGDFHQLVSLEESGIEAECERPSLDGARCNSTGLKPLAGDREQHVPSSFAKAECEQLSLEDARYNPTTLKQSALEGDREQCFPLAHSTPNRLTVNLVETRRHYSSPALLQNPSFVQQTQVEEDGQWDEDQPTETVPKNQDEDATSFRLCVPLAHSTPNQQTLNVVETEYQARTRSSPARLQNPRRSGVTAERSFVEGEGDSDQLVEIEEY